MEIIVGTFVVYNIAEKRLMLPLEIICEPSLKSILMRFLVRCSSILIFLKIIKGNKV